MSINKTVICLTIFTILLIIGIPTASKVINSYNDKKMIVTEKYIVESAERCFFEKVCTNKKVTLKDLYNNHYIKEQMINPISKEVYSEDSYIEISKKESQFYPSYWFSFLFLAIIAPKIEAIINDR